VCTIFLNTLNSGFLVKSMSWALGHIILVLGALDDWVAIIRNYPAPADICSMTSTQRQVSSFEKAELCR
jgi:hypothetical protein